MGADRLKKIKDSAERGWNMAGQRLINPSQLSLFDIDPAFARRSFRINLKAKLPTLIGDELLIHSANENQIVTRGPAIVGECTNIPASIVEELKVGGSICVEVIGVGALTDTIEVAPK